MIGDLGAGQDGPHISICWQLGRERFEKTIKENGELPEDQQIERLNKFFKVYPLERASDSCLEVLRDTAAQKYGGEERQDNIRNLLETMTIFKEAMDGLLSSAPESVSAVWLGLGIIIKIISADLATCKVIVDAFDSIATITLYSLIVEKRYLQSISHNFQEVKGKSMEQQTFDKVQELVCAIFDFSWYTQYYLFPRWHKEISNPTSHAQRLGEKLKAGVRKVGKAFKEAIIGDIKSKHEEIQALYTELQVLGSILFQEATMNDSEDRINQQSIKKSSEKTLEAIETSTQKIEGEIKKGNEEVTEKLERKLQDATETIVEKIKGEPKTPEDIVTRYEEMFQPSTSLNNFLSGLEARKAKDGALTENSWILKNNSYIGWRDYSEHEGQSILCLNGRKGHGKTMTMLSARKDLLDHYNGHEDVILLNFFFKLGDSELQFSLRAFENIIIQLINAVKTRDGSIALLSNILGPGTAKEIEKYTKKSSSQKCKFITDWIKSISSNLGLQLYILLDAIDECQDRSQARLLGTLKGLVSEQNSNIRVLMSVREEINIQNELPEHWNSAFKILTIEPRMTTEEMEDFLKRKLSEIISARVKDRSDQASIAKESEKYWPKLRDKVDGDFTYANMVAANLREPSRMTLGKRIDSLPSRMEEIYRQSLEGMKASERNLIIFALRWVAWSSSGITALQIAEHYRGVYQNPNDEDEAYNDYNYSDPSQDPEIQETISHLRTVGRDFFTFVEETEPITVHLSVREWIRNAVNTEKILPTNATRAKVLNSVGGNLVFEVQIPVTSIPAGHHELSELFNAEESQLAMALDCLRALTNPNFQYEYGVWNPPPGSIAKWNNHFKSQGVTPPPRRYNHKRTGDQPLKIKLRYEILAVWHHLQELEKYYSRSKIEHHSGWKALQRLFTEFMHQKSTLPVWYSFFRLFKDGPRRSSSLNVASHGLHYQSYRRSISPLMFIIELEMELEIGLHSSYLMEMYIYQSGPPPGNLRLEPHKIFTYEYQNDLDWQRFNDEMFRVAGNDVMNPLAMCTMLLLRYRVVALLRLRPGLLPGGSELVESEDEFLEILRFFTKSSPGWATLSAMWGLVELFLHHITSSTIEVLLRSTIPRIFDVLLLKGASCPQGRVREAEQALETCYKKMMQLLLSKVTNGSRDIFLKWQMLQLLIQKGASFGMDIETLLSTIIDECERYKHWYDINIILDRLRVFENCLDSGYGTLETACKSVFTIVRIRHLEIFQKLRSISDTVLDQVDKSGRCIMHVIFQEHEGCGFRFADLRMFFDEIYKARPMFVNAQDNHSRAPLSYAVEHYDINGVLLLLEHGADVQDDDELGQTALHVLCAHDGTLEERIEPNPKKNYGYRSESLENPWYCEEKEKAQQKDFSILKELRSAGILLNSRTKSLATPLMIAFRFQRPAFISQFLEALQESYPYHEYVSSILLAHDADNRNILHYAMGRERLLCSLDKIAMLDVIEKLLSSLDGEQKLVLLNAKDFSSGFTPLHEASRRGFAQFIDLFLTHGSDAQVESADGYPAVYYLVRDGMPDVLGPTARCSHGPLGTSEFKGRWALIDEGLLIELLGNLSVTGQNDNFFTNLRRVAFQRNWEILGEVLSKRGIGSGSQDDYGWNESNMNIVFNGNWNELQNDSCQPLGVILTPSQLRGCGTGNIQGFELGESAENSLGLEVRAPRDPRTPNEEHQELFVADNFIPPIPSRFYFEINFNLEGVGSSFPRSKSNTLQIGLISIPFDASALLDKKQNMTLCWCGNTGRFYNNADASAAPVEVGGCISAETLKSMSKSGGDREGTMGLGFDYPTRKIFFTRNGRLLGPICKVTKRAQWKPSVYVATQNMTQGCMVDWEKIDSLLTVNFGTKEFEFRGWEAPIEDFEPASWEPTRWEGTFGEESS
ncbi:hypothetical protein TWF718_002179 [Orbilia javanica]|uniref:Nephrocystin 3-like N-terminal domain-containing protein n=1 Tax=Orbilia javanica TaxID=47235 RepID=A0AAN8MJP1_9PEZI